MELEHRMVVTANKQRIIDKFEKWQKSDGGGVCATQIYEGGSLASLLPPHQDKTNLTKLSGDANREDLTLSSLNWVFCLSFYY